MLIRRQGRGLGPLDAEETRAYIEHRLRHVGWDNDPAFEPAVFNPIYAFTGGIPRKINTLCDRLLLATFLADRHDVDEVTVREVIEDLKQEFAGPRAGGAATARPAGRPQPLALADDLAALDIPADLAEQVAGLTANYDLQRIEARLSRLEHSLSATLEILNQVLQAARRETPAGKKAS